MTQPDDYNVVYRQFPGDILAAVRTDADGYPTIYINVYLSPEARREALDHELWHIEHGDMTNSITIYDAEKQACARDGLPAIMTKAYQALTEDQTWGLLLASVRLFAFGFEDQPKYIYPISMPEPMFSEKPKDQLMHGR
jgi:hypothetical protein